MSRTQAAFTFSAERLFQQFPKVYFWTWTFKSVPIDDEVAMEDFDTLRSRLTYHFPFFQGVRVAELHKRHGIHFHALVNARIPIARVQRIIYGSGHLTGRNRYLDFGRMGALKCDAGTVGYLASYLGKQYRADNNFGQRRRWGAIGKFNVSHCKDIVYDTATHRNKARIFQDIQIDYATFLLMSHYSTLWGEVADWPEEYKMRLMNYQTRNREDGGRWKPESYRTQAANDRIDVDAIIWRGHIDQCRECAVGYTLCKHGITLWENMIYCDWVYPLDAIQKHTAIEIKVKETPPEEKIFESSLSRNRTLFHPETFGGLTGERDGNGRKVYVLRPHDGLERSMLDAEGDAPF